MAEAGVNIEVLYSDHNHQLILVRIDRMPEVLSRYVVTNTSAAIDTTRAKQ
jgi:hypothetical protein